MLLFVCSESSEKFGMENVFTFMFLPHVCYFLIAK